ncbi:MAG: PA2779 family protein, partial [Gammaproteobacteria bacterium]|nr:PA2779 family protein [Gammaproteobacteria bacterium]
IFMFLGLLQTANAGMVGSQQLLPKISAQVNVGQIRLDIQNQLVDLGVEQQQAENRVAAMTDSQIAEINQKISELPAGASAGGVLLTIFIVLVITDVIGATDIFPFINAVK